MGPASHDPCDAWRRKGERTAREIWNWLPKLPSPAFLWNVFPLHPHNAHDPHSNRLHTRAERDFAIHFLSRLYVELKPRRVVAIGKDALRALDLLCIPCIGVRHPSYGGLPDFRRDIAAILVP